MQLDYENPIIGFRIVTFGAAGKSALITAGIGYGLACAVRALADTNRSSQRMVEVEGRLSRIEASLDRVVSSPQASPQTNHSKDLVSRSEMQQAVAETADRLWLRFDRELDRRLSEHEHSIDALRSLIAQTDELLGRVLENLDAALPEPEMARLDGRR